MRVNDPPAPSSPAVPWRRLGRIAIAGAVAALAVVAIGTIAQRVVLGADDAAARQRVEARVAATVDDMARQLRQMATSVADAGLIRRAADGDVVAARDLFTAAGIPVAAQRELDLAVTVSGLDGQPLAWAGRPSELPLERLQGPEAWFFAFEALGPRLAFVLPVLDGNTRVGTVATERGLLPRDAQPMSAATGLQGISAFRFPTALAPVSIEAPPAGATPGDNPNAFELRSPSGDPLLTAVVAPADLAATRVRWRTATRSVALMVLAVTIALLAGPLLDWRRRGRHAREYAQALGAAAAAVIGARLMLRAAAPERWTDAPIVSGDMYASDFAWPLFASPLDFLLTSLAGGALVALALAAVGAWRLARRRRRRTVAGAQRVAAFAVTQLAAGVGAAAVLAAYETLLRDTIAQTAIDLLRVSLHSLNLAHLALQVGLTISHATALGLVVVLLLLALQPWTVSRGMWRLRLLALACWVAPLAAWRLSGYGSAAFLPLLAALTAAALLALRAPRLEARFRHGSQAFRLALLMMGLVLPALTFYPTVLALSWRAKTQLVETQYAPQALRQHEVVSMRLQESLGDLDRLIDLTALVSPEEPEPLADRAYRAWQITSLARDLITSSVELYGPNGALISRFAFNLPEDLSNLPEELSAAPPSEETQCTWGEVYGEVVPFFAEERRMLHAGKRICADGDRGATRGAVVVHTMLDYENLPFIASQSPYIQLLRPSDPLGAEGLTGRDVEYAHYGWGRTPVYWSGDTAWPLPDDVFARVESSRTPIWAQLRRGDRRYDVHLSNDRLGIHAIGFPAVTLLDHLVNLAELVVLAAGTFVLILVALALHGWLSRRRVTAPTLLRELRASFYRKLFLAFVLAVFVPVTLLALVTRNYVADQMRADIEQEAMRTASVARRVVEDLVASRAAQEAQDPLRVDDDNLMVWVSRLIGQDVNIFMGSRLAATSERNLFASGLLPTRTPADISHALDLRSEATAVARERIGRLEYLVAGTSLLDAVLPAPAVLTVPLTSRQQEIESQIDALDRRVLLAALLFILAGAGLGYTMAERIADPVNRLTRATRRIARGELDARIVATSSDELRRLVEDFNSMAYELQRQRGELERTNRLEAWAEMARQVAHDIKNPLTPIQLNAEHLRRVHADRGAPLGPVLQECVETILTQVRLLRQIAAEFSSFASSPTARPATVDVGELLREVIDPYRPGLEARIQFDIDIPDGLPPVRVDRTLVGRAITNLVENALHAMPGEGRLTVAARAAAEGVRVRIADSGGGMDAQALARAFEPYFSTKATGTGLGLPIAKRNVELSGGTIAITSERDRGTTVEVMLPLEATAAAI